MHNLYAIFAKYLDICKQIADNLVNARGNLPRCDVVPKFSDIQDSFVLLLSIQNRIMEEHFK